MAGSHVVSAPARKRAELSGEIKHTHQHLSKLIADLENLDRTLLLFDPSYPIETIKPKAFRPPDDWSNRREMTRTVLGILRQAAELLTTRDIAFQPVADRARDASDQRLLRLMSKRVGVLSLSLLSSGPALCFSAHQGV